MDTVEHSDDIQKCIQEVQEWRTMYTFIYTSFEFMVLYETF
jgi:hypothetical protein